MINKNMLGYFLVLCLFFSSNCFSLNTKEIKIKNDKRETPELKKRVLDLISKMTLEEKIQQLHYETPAIERLNLKDYNYGNEILHGVVSDDVTIFPPSIALAAMWNLPLINRIGVAASDEARIKYKQGVRWLTYWGPVLNICRDPRWGRIQETYGEDPYLSGRLGVEYIKGLQGDDSNYLKVAAGPKHFAAHSGPEIQRHNFNSVTSERDIFETYLPAFKATVEEGNPYTVMSSYNALNGVPMSMNKRLLTDVLRNKWGFNGYVISDCGALGLIQWSLKIAKSEEEAAQFALQAGLDMECDFVFLRSLGTAIDKKMITESDIDSALYRILKTRFILGEFDPQEKVKYNFIPDSVLNSISNRELSLDASRESLVLLRNEKNTLPLSKNLNSILVLGPNATGFQLGSYSGKNKSFVSVLNGIKSKVGINTKVDYIRASELVGDMTEVIPFKYLFTPDTIPGLKGEYFNNMNFEGNPALIRIDSTINFNWGFDSPDQVLKKDSFSIRWTGFIKVDKTDIYTFKTVSDDGVRFSIEGDRKINEWHDLNGIPYVVFDTLTAGVLYPIVLEYFDDTMWSYIRLEMGNEDTGIDTLKWLNEIASKYDAIIFAGGISISYERELLDVDIPGFNRGDRTSIELPNCQKKIVQNFRKCGKPVILLLHSGGCISTDWDIDTPDAIIQAWYHGEEGGTAVADVIFGDYNPSGKLPLTFYKSLEFVPDFTNYMMKERTYRYFTHPVLYPFGYGLSYSKFDFIPIKLPADTVRLCESDSLSIPFSISNRSTIVGTEVVQIYINNLDSKLKQPIKQLKGFKKIIFSPNQTKTDSVSLSLKELFSYDPSISDYIYESGRYEIQIGSSSADIFIRDTFYLDNCITLSVDEKYSYDYIYPVPAEDILNLSDIRYQENKILKVFNLFGEKIMEFTYKPTLDISKLYQGVYFLRTENKTYKFIK